MIEIIVRKWLEDGGITAVLEMPDPFPGDSFARIEKVGSSPREIGLEAASLAIQSYSDSLYEAAALNSRVKARMAGIRQLDTVCRCQCNSDYNYTDEERKRYRYQAVFDILYYEEE